MEQGVAAVELLVLAELAELAVRFAVELLAVELLVVGQGFVADVCID